VVDGHLQAFLALQVTFVAQGRHQGGMALLGGLVGTRRRVRIDYQLVGHGADIGRLVVGWSKH